MNLLDYQEQIKKICERSDISYLALFGSYAKGKEVHDSDVDLLVDYTSSKSYFDHVRIQRDLANLIGKEVDLVTKRSVHPYIKDSIFKNLKVIYER